MNCLTVALWVWVSGRFRGRLGILGWDRIPHIAIFFEDGTCLHYRAENEKLPAWQMLHFQGQLRYEWTD